MYIHKQYNEIRKEQQYNEIRKELVYLYIHAAVRQFS
jgi:hypothetical protein